MNPNTLDLLQKKKVLEDELTKLRSILKRKQKKISGHWYTIVIKKGKSYLQAEDEERHTFIPFSELKGMIEYLDSLTPDKLQAWKKEMRQFDREVYPEGSIENGQGELDKLETERMAKFCPKYKKYFKFYVFADTPTLYLELGSGDNSMWVYLRDIKKLSCFFKSVLEGTF